MTEECDGSVTIVVPEPAETDVKAPPSEPEDEEQRTNFILVWARAGGDKKERRIEKPYLLSHHFYHLTIKLRHS